MGVAGLGGAMSRLSRTLSALELPALLAVPVLMVALALAGVDATAGLTLLVALLAVGLVFASFEASRPPLRQLMPTATGDLGIMDAEGNITIKGRSKNMLLGASGQNIYPEEIEDKLNNMPFVAESIIIQQTDGKLAALIYPDFDDAFAHGMNNDAITQAMEENRIALNAELPAYSQITRVKIYPEEFEKTPKKSIKRFLYQEVK